MKTVRVTYTVLHSFEVPNDWDDEDIKFAVEGYAENNGFYSLCNDIEIDIESGREVRSITM